jgi:hypothetical protein
MEQQSTLLSLTKDNHLAHAFQSVPMTQQQIPLPTLETGEHELNQISIPSVNHFPHKKEINFANPSSNLRSNVKPQELLEKLPLEPRVLKVSKEDIKALSQVIMEFQEQFMNY